MRFLIRLFDRLLPALLIGASVTFLAAGLMAYAPPPFGDLQTQEPTSDGGDPLFSPVAPELPTAVPSPTSMATPTSGTPTPTPPWLRTATPGGSPLPTPTATAPPPPAGSGIASRIRIPSLSVDLPVVPGDLDVRGNRNDYPLCDVAMYLPEFGQPGQLGTTYIYAHAQQGMFLPLLRASRVNEGASMLGALVEVFTNEGQLHLYEIFRVKRHATDLAITQVGPGEHRLVLQTSEGTTGTIPKLQVAARPIAVVPADIGEANPRPRPRVCLPRG